MTFVQELGLHNLCTYYLLPLLELNKDSFGGQSNFINCYVNKAGTILSVELCDLQLSVSHAKHTNFIKEETTDLFSYKYFHMPDKWNKDIQLFLTGKYSKFSDKAKEAIFTHSGLPNREPDDKGVLLTDVRLLALDRSPLLRKKWEEEIGTVIPEDMELMEPPGPKTYREMV